MSDYLKERYPDAYIYVSDHKEIICKLTTKDLAGNELVVLQKLLSRPGGYIEIALVCQPSERTRYEKAFRDINFH